MARKRRTQLDTMDEINMTPLIDLTFLLLIIFMITAPLLESGINVSPPEMTADKLPEDNIAIINLDKLGQIVYKNQVMRENELISTVSNLYNNNNKINILIRADGLRKYKEVISLMKMVKKSGVKNISLVTQSED